MKEVKKVIKKFDKLGRVVVPIEIREKFDLKSQDKIEIFVSNDIIFLKKYKDSCLFCEGTEHLNIFNGKFVCDKCKEKIKKLANEL